MNYSLYLVGSTPITDAEFTALKLRLAQAGFDRLDSISAYTAPRTSMKFQSDENQMSLKDSLAEQLSSLPLDGFVLEDTDCLAPELLIMDMDSTLVQAETIDQIANHAGVMSQVSAITESAMRGELDFTQSLTQRVAMLAGLKTHHLDQVHSALPLTSGAESLISAANSQRCMTVLVSGGFSYFAKPIADRIGIDEVYANELEFSGGELTGKVSGTIVDAEFKRDTLNRLIAEHQLSRSKTIAIGDGANDLLMLSAAGLGIAFHGKPKVQRQARSVINHYGLEALQWLLAW